MQTFRKFVNLVVALSIAVLFVFQGAAGVSADEPEPAPQAGTPTRRAVQMVTDEAGNILAWEEVPALPGAGQVESHSAGEAEVSAAESTVVVVSEDFEGAFPGQGWTLTNATTGKEYFWGPTTLKNHTPGGRKSAWPAAGGANGFGEGGNPTLPPDKIYTRLMYGPFDLSNATAAQVDYYIWRDTPADNSIGMGIFASTDLQHWSGYVQSGVTNGWIKEETLDLKEMSFVGQRNVYVGFVFQDVSGHTGLEGIFIDDIVITKTVPSQACYTLTINVSPAGAGTVTANPPPNCNGTQYTSGTLVRLTPIANGGTFERWTGDFNSTNVPLAIVMNSNKTVTANFSSSNPGYTLTTSVNPPNSGTISVSPAGPYNPGTTVNLTAQPATGYDFTNWSGDAQGTNPTTQVTMSANKSVTANFTKKCYTLTLDADANKGSINASPSPNCGDGIRYTHGTSVTLTAVRKTGYILSSWGGDAQGSSAQTTVLMDGNKTVTATFDDLCYPLTVTAGEGGSVSRDKNPNCGDKYREGTSVKLTATHNEGYEFTGWSGSGTSGSSNPLTVVMNSAKDITANFSMLCYTLTADASPADGGSITRDKQPNCADGKKYSHGTQVKLTASANTGHTFAGWSGDSQSTEAVITVTMTGNRSVTANFTRNCYPLTLNADPAKGSISASSDGRCGEGSYYYGTQVTLKAIPKLGFEFTGWTGDMPGSEAEFTFTITGPATLTANFTIACYTLNTSVTPAGAGSVHVSAQPTCNGNSEYFYDTEVTLTATAEQGHTFTGWGGDLTADTPEITIRMTRDWNISGVFDDQCFTLTIPGSTGGSVTRDKQPNCNGNTQYSYGTQVKLTASPATGYQFIGWSGSVTGSANPVTVTMNENKQITASFDKLCFSITTSIKLDGGDGVPVSPAGSIQVSPEPNCNGKYKYDTPVTVTAKPAQGYTFTYWEGDLTGSVPSRTFNIRANTSITVNFEAECHQLTIRRDPAAGGSASARGSGSCGGGKYKHGTQVELTATANTGFEFHQWTGDVESTEAVTTFTITGPTTVTAVFDSMCYSLTTAVEPAVGGSIQVSTAPDCAGGGHSHGKQVTLTAMPAAGYNFTGWSGDSTAGTAAITITMDGDVTLTANFVIQCFTLTRTPGAGGSITASPAGTCSGGKYEYGTTVTVEAKPDPGFKFTGWGGSLSGTTNPTAVKMTANRTVTASFAPDVPAPVLSSVSQSTILSGVKNVRLTLTGSGFVPESTITWNGVTLAQVQYVSATQLQVAVPDELLNIPGLVQIVVVNPASAGGPSNPITLEVLAMHRVYLPISVR